MEIYEKTVEVLAPEVNKLLNFMYFQVSDYLSNLAFAAVGLDQNLLTGTWHFVPVLFPSKGKGKAIPLQAWTGPEGFRRLRLPDFKTIST